MLVEDWTSVEQETEQTKPYVSEKEGGTTFKLRNSFTTDDHMTKSTTGNSFRCICKGMEHYLS